MYSNVVRRALTQIVVRNNPSGTKLIAVAGIHTSSRKNDSIGDWIQHLRFKYYHDPRHHLDNDKWAKIFAVEGNINSGKGDFAKEFAERLDLRYFPACDYTYVLTAKERHFHPEEIEFLLQEDHIYKKGLDASLERIYTNPEDWAQMARYQKAMLKAKFYQYADATAHLISTGQGVVIERSFYSMPIFEHAFKKMKWQKKEVLSYLREYWLFMQQNCLPPQVVLYLDVPAGMCHENLQKNGNEIEKKIPLQYLQVLEEGYSKYLVEAERFGSMIMHLDWTKDRDVEEVIMEMDDMESLQLPHCRWDWRNNDLKTMMREFENNSMLTKMSTLTCPIEEMWNPAWYFYAMPIYNRSRRWYQLGFKNDKWAWLREPEYKDNRGFLL